MQIYKYIHQVYAQDVFGPLLQLNLQFLIPSKVKTFRYKTYTSSLRYVKRALLITVNRQN